MSLQGWQRAVRNLDPASGISIFCRWFVIDAAGKPLGRTAVKAADILRGKHRPEFTPHADCGEFVIIVNADKAILTGKKLEQKYYRYHSGYIGGLKEIQYKTLMATKPEKAMELAVKGLDLLTVARCLLNCNDIWNLCQTQTCLGSHVGACSARHVIKYDRLVGRLSNSLEVLVLTLLSRLVVVWHDDQERIHTMGLKHLHAPYGMLE